MKFLPIASLALLSLMPTLYAAPPSGLDPSVLAHPTVDSWPTYNGDYSGRRFSSLTKINDQNVKSMSLAWMYQLSESGDPSGGRMSATPLVVNGVMYFTVPDKVWAIDARSG